MKPRTKIAKYLRENFTSFMNTPLKTLLLIGFITLVMTTVTLGGFEWYARANLPKADIYAKVPPSSYIRYHPYLANLCEGPLDHSGTWWDTNHKQLVPFHIKSNNLGLRIPFDLYVMNEYKKVPNERVVLLFGGSAVYGIGASSNEATIDAYLQKELNNRQKQYHYTVFNLGVNGWNAYQQTILLNLYGMNLHPDWVIFMDGNNDMMNLVGNELLKDLLEEDVQSDIGSPMVTPLARNIMDGHYFRRLKPEFYRSKIENNLLKWSAAYRFISGKDYIPRTQQTNLPSVRGWKQIDDTVDFYLRAQNSALMMCPGCNYILSTQAYYSKGKKTLLKDERQRLRERLKDFEFTSAFFKAPNFEEVIMFYTLGRVKDELPVLCHKSGSRCHYMAIDNYFPKNDEEKERYFIDTVHLLDAGNERVAKAYADTILGAAH